MRVKQTVFQKCIPSTIAVICVLCTRIVGEENLLLAKVMGFKDTVILLGHSSTVAFTVLAWICYQKIIET